MSTEVVVALTSGLDWLLITEREKDCYAASS
jgi:hypothetical protein